jgi:site-specific DNA-methyltransferase (adenine-specific)
MIYTGDCLDVLRTLPADSVDAIVTDPPYGLAFMGKKWDYDVPSEEIWRECLRVLKPGGHLLAFAGTRTQHRMAVRIEDAGFEIRDLIAWVYGSGFPKSLNLDGEHKGWGTALKPALEPITVARKPLIGTVAENVLAHGTGALNVDKCRVGTDGGTAKGSKPMGEGNGIYGAGLHGACEITQLSAGRWPANLIHDGSDEVVGLFPVTGASKAAPRGGTNPNPMNWGNGRTDGDIVKGHTDNGGSAARFFYCAKASKRDRDEGNNHPTVKPPDLMRYLCRLVTPPGGIVLDPFMGSGSTGKAAMLEGFDFIGIERDPEYVKIAEARINEAKRLI